MTTEQTRQAARDALIAAAHSSTEICNGTVPLLSVSGHKCSGKTTLVDSLISRYGDGKPWVKLRESTDIFRDELVQKRRRLPEVLRLPLLSSGRRGYGLDVLRSHLVRATAEGANGVWMERYVWDSLAHRVAAQIDDDPVRTFISIAGDSYVIPDVAV